MVNSSRSSDIPEVPVPGEPPPAIHLTRGGRPALWFWLGTWGPVVLLMSLIFLLSAQASPLAVVAKGARDVVGTAGHFAEYGVLAVALRRALTRQWPGLSWPGWWAWGLALAYAGSDEWHQFYVPGRDAEGWDLAVDACGAGLALLVIHLHLRRRSADAGKPTLM